MEDKDFFDLAQTATQARQPDAKNGISFSLSVTITIVVLVVQVTLVWVQLNDKINHEFLREWGRQWKILNPTLSVPDVDSVQRTVDGRNRN
jgi:hypothetical protein